MASAIAVIFSLLATGCTAYKPVQLESQQLRDQLPLGDIVRAGDRVRLHMNSGEVHQVVVETLDETEMQTSKGTYRFRDIASIESRDFSRARTTALVVGTTLVTYLLISALVASMAFFP
ncbi:MAG: hypothetical protein HUJ31_09485 [Pseudomonadales bacterium]|nr:hypothetical protein [Pseudomonadales bacterium]